MAETPSGSPGHGISVSATQAVRIAVVDSGIDGAHPGLRGGPVLTLACCVDADGSVHQEPPGRDALGHGTAVAVTMRALAPTADLIAVRVFADQARCSTAMLTAALRHCVRLDVQFVNVSLGIAASFDRLGELAQGELAAAVTELLRAGRRLITPAATATGLASAPGVFSGVDVVVADANVDRARPQWRRAGPRNVWFASPFPPDGIAGLPPQRIHGASLAVANVTGHLAAAHFVVGR